MPSSVSPINQNLPTAETAVPAASDNAYDALDSPGAPAPIEPEPEPDELPARSARPGLKLRLSVLFYEIDPRVRHEFFARFEKELREAFPDLPEISYDNQHFDNAVYGLLKRPAFLPEPMRNALLAIQELAAPANRQLLRALATHRSIYCEHQATPEHVAVGYWLKFPFQPGELESLRASVPSHLLSPPKPRSNGEATDDEGGLPWPETV
jgi:hypothetical protein